MGIRYLYGGSEVRKVREGSAGSLRGSSGFLGFENVSGLGLALTLGYSLWMIVLLWRGGLGDVLLFVN